MKKLFSLLLLVSSIGQGNSALAQAQTYQQTWGPVTKTGPIGTARNYRIYGVVPTNYTIDWFNDGTPATACTYRIEGSSDGLPNHYHSLSPDLSCINYDEKNDGGSSSMSHVNAKPVMFIQVRILTFTAGDSTTAVSFNYTRGQ